MAALPESAGNAASKRAIDDAKSHAAPYHARASTPPPRSDRGRLESKHALDNPSNRSLRSSTRRSDAARASPFDIDAVDSALLRDFQRPQRESTPGTSPHRKRQRINGDRFVQPGSAFVLIQLLILVDSSPLALARTCRRASVSCMRMAPPPPPPRRSALLTANFTSKKVCYR